MKSINKLQNIKLLFLLNNMLLDRSELLKYKKKQGIYSLYNKINNKYYIGSTTKCLYDRISRYYKPSELNSSNRIINKALLKYGYENFSILILETYTNESNTYILNREQFYLDLLKPIYNVAKIAGNTSGVLHTEETKMKLRELKLGTLLNESAKENMRIKLLGNTNSLGHIHSDFSKLKMGKSRENPIYVYNINNEFIYKLDSYNNAATHFECNRSSISKYTNSNLIFKNNYYLKSKILIKIELYDINYNLIQLFDKYNEIALYLNVNISSIYSYIKSERLFLEKYYIKVIKDFPN